MTPENENPAGDFPPVSTLTDPIETPESPPTPSPDPVTSQDFAPLDELIRTHAESEPSEPTSAEDPFPISPSFESAEPEQSSAPVSTPEPFVPVEMPPPGGSSASSGDPIQKIRDFSENLIPTPVFVPAQLPFSLKIEGTLPEADRARFLDFLGRENLGIREVDLEPQFQEGKILVPQISEFAAISIVHLLRDSGAKFQMGPADKVYKGAEHDEFSEPEHPSVSLVQDGDENPVHLARGLPIFSAKTLPGPHSCTALDTVSASSTLKATVVEFSKTPEFDEMIESLKNELRYKAYRKGATAILEYSLQLSPLSMPTLYRVIVSGVAVRQEMKHEPSA